MKLGERDDIGVLREAIVGDLLDVYKETDRFTVHFAKHMMRNHKNAKFGSSVEFDVDKGKRGWESEFQLAMMTIANKPIYRLNVHRNASVDTDCYDLLDNFAPELETHYNHVSDLPMWAQEKLAVLMILDPTKVNGEIPNVGRRINEQVFWVYNDGNETESDSQ